MTACSASPFIPTITKTLQRLTMSARLCSRSSRSFSSLITSSAGRGSESQALAARKKLLVLEGRHQEATGCQEEIASSLEAQTYARSRGVKLRLTIIHLFYTEHHYGTGPRSIAQIPEE